MRTITHLLAAGVAATALVAGSAAAATAQSQTIKDKRADVVRYADLADESGTVLDRQASIDSGIDAKSATVKYTKKSLKVTIKFAKLTKEPVSLQSVIRVKGKKAPSFVIFNDSGHKKVSVYNGSMSKKLCNGTMTRKTGKNGSASFTVKRKCLKNAKKIKAQTGVFTMRESDEAESGLSVDFEAISAKQFKTPAWTKWLKAS